MSFGRVQNTYARRLSTAVTTTVVGDNTTKTIPVDSYAVHFSEDGGQFEHQPTGDIYNYSAADPDLETITLSAGLPVGKTLSADDALIAVQIEFGDTTYVRGEDMYLDVAIDDVVTDTVPWRVPQDVRDQVKEGGRKLQSGDAVRGDADDEEWTFTERMGQPNPGPWQPGFLIPTAGGVSGGGKLLFRAWLKCDGSTVSRATYPDLFNAIGTTFGSTSSTNFKLPDLVGRTIFGAGSAVALGETDGNSASTRGPSHTHSIDNTAHTHDGVSWSGTSTATGANTGGGLNRIQTISGSVDGTHTHGNSGAHDHTGFTGGGLGSPNVIGYIGIHYLIHI